MPNSRNSILVAVRDPSARKQIAVRKAARIAAATGAELTLFHAFSTPLAVPMPTTTDAESILQAAARQRRAQLLEVARPLRAEGLKVQCEAVWDFPPAHAIVRRVAQFKPDLVIAESQRHSRLARWFLANSDWELIRECPCPVWFVKQERLAKRPLLLTAIDPTHARSKPTALDDRLLQAAKKLSRQLDGSIALIHVEDTSQLVRGTRAESIDRLARRNRVAAAPRVLRTGVPAVVLAAAATELKADVLVMGAVSRSGLSHYHIGSTAEAVIDAVSCDVLVVKPRQFKSAVARRYPKLST